MSFGNKYNKDCGCSSKKKTSCGCANKGKKYNDDGCCKTPIAQPPCPVCVSHDTVEVAANCLRPSCTLTATDGRFTIKFKNADKNDIPLNAAEVYLYHAVAGFMTIHGADGNGIEVSLVDSTKSNSIIQEDDCIMVQAAFQSALLPSTSTKCLSGKFKVPAQGATETAYIYNGTGIPVGSTVTFTHEGNVGSYSVESYDSNDGLLFAYTLKNDGSGHSNVGDIIDAGDCGECTIPIEVDTSVDICNSSVTTVIDTLSGCKDGSPRQLKPTTDQQIAVSNSSLKWELQRLSNTDCCVTIQGCMKFREVDGCEATDTVTLNDPVPECWGEKIASAQTETGQPIPINVEGKPFVVVAYNPTTKVLELSPKDESIFTTPEEVIEYGEDTQLCFGECCNSCNQGEQITDHNRIASVSGQADVAPFAFDLNDLTYTDGTFTRYLVGIAFNSVTGAIETQAIDATFNDDPDTGGPLIPRISDNLMIRQKICNTSTKGCNQVAEVEFNTELEFGGLGDGVTAHYEWGHFAAPSKTLADGTTLNPFNNISAQANYADCAMGPSHEETEFITDTAIASGGAGNRKRFPFKAGTFKDYIDLQRCDCAMSIVWLFVKIESQPGQGGGTLNLAGSIRRVIKKKDHSLIDTPDNDPAAEGFKTP